MNIASVLKRELPQWVDDGLVEQSQADAISERYRLDDDSTAGLVLPAIYIIGACLVGGGAVSFVAANWDSIPIPVRIGLLLTVMLGCETSGFILWKTRGTREKLGQALVALGAVIFGANVFLIAQIYHLHGPPHIAFGVWTLGALAVAYATFSSPTMALACITSFVWSTGWIDTHPHDLCWYPLAICAACIPFLLRRSAMVFTGLMLAAGAAVSVCAGKDSGEQWATYASLIALGALYSGLGQWLRRGENTVHLAAPALRLGGLGVLIPAFLLSFHHGPESDMVRKLWVSEGWLWTVLLGLVYVGAAVSWLAALNRAPGEGERRMIRPLSMLAATLLVTAGIAAGHDVVLTVMANLALVGIAGGLLWDAVAAGHRREFWMGLGLLSLVMVSRFLEWDTHLMVKSAVFVLCGIGVVLGGVRFEKRLKGDKP
jgi:uncharacterized membrane protein